MAYRPSYGRAEAWEDKDKLSGSLRAKPGAHGDCRHGAEEGFVLNEVLRQMEEERARSQSEMEKLKADVRSQQVILAQIAESLLGGAIEQAIDQSRQELQKQQQQLDLQAAALREALLDLGEHKEAFAARGSELQQALGEVREDLTIETKGCIEAACSKVAQECRAMLAEELAAARRDTEELAAELKSKTERDIAAQDALKRLEDLSQATECKVEALGQTIQKMPDPTEALNAQLANVSAAQQAAADARTLAANLEGQLQTAAAAAAAAEGQAKMVQEALEATVHAVGTAENHAKTASEAQELASRAVCVAESHAKTASEAQELAGRAVGVAESHAKTASEAQELAGRAVGVAESHAKTASEAQELAGRAAALAEEHSGDTQQTAARVGAQAAEAEGHVQSAQKALEDATAAASAAESNMQSAQKAMETTTAAVGSAEAAAEQAQGAAGSAHAAVEATENHAGAARNALAAVQTNADTVREKVAQVEHHAASVKDAAAQMAEQASALQETSSQVALASDRAASALGSEAERHLAAMAAMAASVSSFQEKLRETEGAGAPAVSVSAEDLRERQELRTQVQELKAQLGEPEASVRADLAECAQLTQLLSQRFEAVEGELRGELSRIEAAIARSALSPKDGDEGSSTSARLEEMINTALERTDHLEQNLIAAANGHNFQLPDQAREELQSQIDDLKSRSTSCETRLLQELARVSEAMRPQSREEAPEPKDQVRSVPAALRGMVLSALPVPTGRRKALVIGCGYFESSMPLAGAMNDAWNVLSLLRHTLQFPESQVRFLVDGTRSCPMPVQRRPTAQTISESLQWLTHDAQPGDQLFLYYAGYGLLLPHGVGSFESCLVPIDFAAMAAETSGSGYRLVPLLDVSMALSRLPPACKVTVVLDCCHAALPGLGSKPQPAVFQWAQMQPPAFAGLEEAGVGFDPRARRLVLPSVPLSAQRAPAQVPNFNCALTCYAACHQAQWCAELPIEGVVQGAFTWAWVKAMVAGACEGHAGQMQGLLQTHMSDLQRRYRWLDQTPMLQMSKAVEEHRAEAPPVPDIMRNPLPANVRRKALIIGINYAGSHAQLKGAVNDAWNLHSVLRQALLMEEDKIRILVDGENGVPARPSQAPTKANILTNFQWLMEGAQPGDSLILAFCGFGTQHQKDAEGKECEAYLVPSDYAADVPKEWWAQVTSKEPQQGAAVRASGAYRLISMLELNRYITQIPAGATLTTLLDCSYPSLPGVSPSCNPPPTFPKITRGRVDYEKLFDFVSRPRFLELPQLPVQHTPPQIWRPQTFPSCKLHCFCACRLQEWDAELPLEGTVQGTFTWAFAKALAAGGLRGSVGQQQQALESITAGLKEHFQGVEQTPVLMLSQAASLADTVFA